MLDLGMSEIMLIVVVAIIVCKPEDLPHIIRSIAKFWSKVRGYVGDISNEFNKIKEDIDVSGEVKGRIQDLEGEWRETYDLSDIEEYCNLEAQEPEERKEEVKKEKENKNDA